MVFFKKEARSFGSERPSRSERKPPHLDNSFSQPETRKAMKLNEFKELLMYIDKNHSFAKVKGLKIKYVTPVVDMRTKSIHSITFNGMFEEKQFSITNENKNRSLRNMIYEWFGGEMK